MDKKGLSYPYYIKRNRSIYIKKTDALSGRHVLITRRFRYGVGASWTAKSGLFATDVAPQPRNERGVRARRGRARRRKDYVAVKTKRRDIN